MESHTYHLRIGEGRRIVLPPEVCRSLDLDVGGTVIVRIEDDKATLNSVERTIERFQTLVGSRVPQGASLVDELIAERESAARRE